MNAAEAKVRIGEADRKLSTGDFPEAAVQYSSIIAALPRNGEGQEHLIEAYDGLVTALVSERRWMRALQAFRQYVGDCAPRCEPVYDALYCDGLLTTRTSPLPFMRRQRFYSLVQIFRRTLPLQGLIAECGCFRGLSSFLLCGILKLAANGGFDGQGYRIFDSFQGLSIPQPEDLVDDSDPQAERLRQMTRAGRFVASLEHVKESLRAFPRIEFFPGWIPGSFPHEPAARYRFIHLDVDVHQPTRDSLEYFYPKVVPGGIIVCDDYGWPGARKAVDDFCARIGVSFEVTPHLQAFIVRPA
jgi:O-methyltransferase